MSADFLFRKKDGERKREQKQIMPTLKMRVYLMIPIPLFGLAEDMFYKMDGALDDYEFSICDRKTKTFSKALMATILKKYDIVRFIAKEQIKFADKFDVLHHYPYKDPSILRDDMCFYAVIEDPPQRRGYRKKYYRGAKCPFEKGPDNVLIRIEYNVE